MSGRLWSLCAVVAVALLLVASVDAAKKKKNSEEDFFADTNVVSLTDKTFNDAIASKPNIFVMFFVRPIFPRALLLPPRAQVDFLNIL